MTVSQLALLGIGTVMGMLHDLQCFRKARNLAVLTQAPAPSFDWICFGMHVAQGASAGLGAGQMAGAFHGF